MIKQKIEDFYARNRATLLGVGPMSLNCVDAVIELANEYDVPLMLIASRRQIDSEDFGGGYVNNWTTEDYSRYVIDRDLKGKVMLARDHGGPWQSDVEKDSKLSLRRAMDSAKKSYKADLDAGFQILHIDPSVDIHGNPNIDEVLDRIFELYEYCWSYAQEQRRDIIFEIGTEEQSGTTNTQEELDYTLNALQGFCNKNAIPYPTFVVIQCGTRVMETKNVGSFDSPVRVADEVPAEIQLPKMIEICNRYNVFMKEHNADYLSDKSLQWHPRLGIHAANVAPEFGVAETKALLTILDDNGLNQMANHFVELAYDSKKWQKWMLPESKATDRDRAIIAGHYVFSSQSCLELKDSARLALVSKGIDLDLHLKNEVKRSIMRYLRNFRLVS